MIALGEHADGWILPVRAQPNARRPGVGGEQNGALKVAVSAPAQDGRANDAVREALADALGLRRSQVELLSGQSARDKRFLIHDISRTELEARIIALLGG
jgi:uncharacterized protein